MPSIAAHFEALRHRFPAQSGLQITRTQHSFETMEFVANVEPRPPYARCAFVEMGITKLLIWEMDDRCDRFQIFATFYNIPLGVLQLSSKPSGLIYVAGFPIDLALLASFIAAHFKPVVAQQSDTKKKILLFGYAESFGHHFWNEVSGLASAIETGLFDSLDGVLVGPFDYFHLAPFIESKGKQVWKSNNPGALLPDQLVIYNNNVVTEEARRLVLHNASSQATQPAKESGPTICFQIRRHRRPWIHEETKLIEIMSACERAWPGTNFIIDGHSTSKGLASVPQSIIAAEMAFVAKMALKLGTGIDIRSTIGMDINEKINILKNIDLFVGPIGSGGVLSSWLLRKPTVAYGPTTFLDMAMHQEGLVPEGGPMTNLVPKESVTDLQDADSSFDVDASTIFRLIREAMMAANKQLKINDNLKEHL